MSAMFERHMYRLWSGLERHSPSMSSVTRNSESDWNQTASLWGRKSRSTVRVVTVITLDTTALLLVWAFLELVCRSERRREGMIFILKLCHINSVIITMIFFNFTLYLHPQNASCSAVVGLVYVSALCSLSWALLTCLQRFLMCRQAGPEQIRSQRMALGITLLYLIVGYGLPCAGLLTLMMHFNTRSYVAKTMCWLSGEAIWWMIVPAAFFVGGTYSLAVLAFRLYADTPFDVRCFVYSSFLLNVLMSASMLLVQADVIWPSIHKAYVILLLMVSHNVIIWFHLTDAFLEFCPCTHPPDEFLDPHTNAPARPRTLHTLMIAPPSSRRRSRGHGHTPRRVQSDAAQTLPDQGEGPATGRHAISPTPQQPPTKEEFDKKSQCEYYVDDMGASDEEMIVLDGLGRENGEGEACEHTAPAQAHVCGKPGAVRDQQCSNMCPTESPGIVNLSKEERRPDACQLKLDG